MESNTAPAPSNEQNSRRLFSIVPRISVEELWTNNSKIQDATKQADLITTVSPGIRVTSDGARLKTYIDYSLNQILYARNSGSNEVRNLLNSFGTFEAVEKFAYIDFNGNISQQSISAFGPQADNSTSVNSNRTEVSTIRISPYIRGRISDFASYQARYSHSTTRSKSALVSDNILESFNASLAGENKSRLINWTTELSRQKSDFNLGRTTEADRFKGVVNYVLTPQFNVGAIGGWESNNYASVDKKSYNTYGFNANWAVSQRTKLSATVENRFFGRSHNLTFEHRTPRTAWRFTDNRDVSIASNSQVAGSQGPLYDLIFSQFASLEPDPVKRAQLVQTFLQNNGLNGATSANVGFLNSGATLQRRQDLSFTLLGLRDTVGLIATQSRSSRLSDISTGAGDLSNTSMVQQRGLSLSYSRRLTPLTSFNALVSELHSSGDLTQQSSTLRSLNLSISTRLGLKTTATLGARRVMSDSASFPYSETAVLGRVSVQF